MHCYACAEKLHDSELFCRRCGAQTVLSPSQKSVGTLAVAGYFGLGVTIFALLFLSAIALVTLLLPQSASPQLALFILIILGALAAGIAGASIARGKSRRTLRPPVTEDRESQRTVADAGPRQLPEQQTFPVPPSVVESTTHKLR